MTAATPYLKLPLAFDVERMRQELAGIPASAWIAHYNTGAYDNGWSCVPLRSVGGRADHILALDQGGFEDTPWLEQCPYLREVVASFRCEKTSVRLMALDPGAVVAEHRDPGTALEEGLTRIHVPIATTAQATLKIEGEVVHFSAGHAWYLNAACLHGVENRGPAPRVHLMIDCRTNDWVRDLFREAGGIWQVPLTAEEQAMLRGERVAWQSGQDLRGWMPVTFNAGAQGRPEVGWRFLGERPLSAPFVEDTLFYQPHGERRVCFTPPAALDTIRDSVKPTAFIFHVSRCGSTLLTQMLATLDSCIALSEPPALDAFFRFHHRDAVRSGGEAVFRGLLAALAQRRSGRERHCVVKLDSWHVAWAGWLRKAFPATPFVLVYRDPREVLASHRRQRGRQMIRGLIDLSRLHVDVAGLKPADLDGHASRVLDAVFAGALNMAEDPGTRLVEYSQLPQVLPDALMPQWGIACTGAERDAMLARARLHSKDATRRFESDTAADAPRDDAPQGLALECYERLESMRIARA